MKEEKINKILKEYASILNLLYTAGVIRTYNSPVGDYAEWLVSTKLGLELQKNSAAGFDALDKKTKERYQIKSRWMHSGKNGKHLNVIRDYDKRPFDYLIAVIFGKEFDVEEAYLIPFEIIKEYFNLNEHQNGIVVSLTKRFLADTRIQDITHKLR